MNSVGENASTQRLSHIIDKYHKNRLGLELKGTILLKQAGKNEECYVLFPNLLFYLSSSEKNQKKQNKKTKTTTKKTSCHL